MAATVGAAARGARVASVGVALLTMIIFGGLVVATASDTAVPGVLQDARGNVVVGLALLAVSWTLPRRSRIAPALAAATAIAASITMVEFIAGERWVLDRWLPVAPSPEHTRVPLAAAVCLLGLAAARVVPADRRGRRVDRIGVRLAEATGLAVLAVSGVGVIGYVFYEATASPEAGIGFVPPLPALALLVLAGVTLVNVPDGFVIRVLTGADPGAYLLRRVLPLTLVAVPSIGLAVVLARAAGLLPFGVGAPLAVITVMVVVSLALARTATALRASDRSREDATRALTAVNYDLEQRVRERAEQLRAERTAGDILLERDRIAADMHDHVIQRLYAVGMDLDRRAIAAGFEADTTLDGIDAAIADLRHTIHDLRTAPPTAGLEATVRDIAGASAHAFARPPAVTVVGRLEDVPHELRVNLVAVVREAVSNAARHSGADQLTLTLATTDAGLTLTVEDDGRGIPDGIESTSGLRNIRDRAARTGGVATWQRRDGGGTVLTWFVPFPDAQDDDRPTTGRLSEAISGFAARLTHGLHRDRLPFAADQLRDVLGADAATALTPRPDGLFVAWSVGFPSDARPEGSLYPYAGSLTGHVATTRRPVRVARVGVAPVAASAASSAASFGPCLAIPVAGADGLHGVIGLLRVAGADLFTPADEQVAMLFATCVAHLIDQQPTVVRPPRRGLPLGLVPTE